MKTNFIIICLFFFTTSVYARSNFCPEAGFSDEQKAKVKEMRNHVKSSTHDMSKEDRQAAWSIFQQNVLETVATTEKQKTALSKCFEQYKHKGERRKKFCPEEAGLSDEQKAKMIEMRNHVKSSTHDMNKEDRRAAWSTFRQNVLETVATTEEQRAALSKCFEQYTHKYKHKHSGHKNKKRD